MGEIAVPQYEDTTLAAISDLIASQIDNRLLGKQGGMLRGTVGGTVLKLSQDKLSGGETMPSTPSPALEDVKAYNTTKKITSDAEAERFYNYYAARGQFFWDGNKRTSLTVANKILVSGGAGILTITDTHMEEFNTLLLDYYNSGDTAKIKPFLYECAIEGMEI